MGPMVNPSTGTRPIVSVTRTPVTHDRLPVGRNAVALDAAQLLTITPATATATSGGSATYTATAENVCGEALNASDVIWASFLPGSSAASATADGSAVASAPTMEALTASGTVAITVTAPTAASLPSSLSGTVVVQDLPTNPDQVKTAQFND